MTRYPFIDCQGLAGAWTLGTVQTGRFELVHRASLPGGFGDTSIDANRRLIGDGWHQEVGEQPQWTPVTSGAAYVCGTPPCSGFSLMNVSKKGNARGPNSGINSCMRDLARYGARVRGLDGNQGAEVISFESVQQAYTTGRGLMQELRQIVEEESGQRYDLTHVLMSGASIGASQARHRYYWVVHRVPFGVDHPEPHKVATYADAIDDLRDLELTWEDQPITRPPTEWSKRLRRPDWKVDAHVAHVEEKIRLVRLINELLGTTEWPPGKGMKELIQELPEPPKALLDRWPGYDETSWRQLRGWGWPKRIRPDRPGYVIAGSGAMNFVHYAEPRLLTIRELTRLMGYPDDWRWPADVSVGVASKLIGKCCPVDSGRWISGWVARSLDGEPGTGQEKIGEREYLHNSSLDYRRWPREISGWQGTSKTAV